MRITPVIIMIKVNNSFFIFFSVIWFIYEI